MTFMKKRKHLRPKRHVLHGHMMKKMLSFNALSGNEIKKWFNHDTKEGKIIPAGGSKHEF